MRAGGWVNLPPMQHPGRLNRRLLLTSLATFGLGALRPRFASAKPRFDVLELKTAIVGRIAEFVNWPIEAGLHDPQRPGIVRRKSHPEAEVLGVVLQAGCLRFSSSGQRGRRLTP
mgnify:CR=1 FL=1